jgi:AcrR family transcriptional regulator
MCARQYRTERRKEAAEQTRARIVTAARELLADSSGVSGFSIDAVASRAGVARMTVYYQFGSRRGLLEALFDELASRGQIGRLAGAFALPEALDSLDEFVAIFGRFFGTDRLVLRRLRALAVLDAEFEEAMRARDERRRGALRVLLGRLAQQYGEALAGPFDETLETLYTLTSFETFDSLAGSNRSPEEIVPVIRRLARTALGFPAG